MRRPRWWLAGAALGFVLGLALWLGGVLEPLERRFGDGLLRLRGVDRDPTPFAVVLLDARTFRAWPEPTPAWGGHLAALVDALGAAGVRDVALDFVLTSDPRADGLARADGRLSDVSEANARLGEAILRRPGRMVLGYRANADGKRILPAEELRLSDAELAFLDLPDESDGVLREGVRRSFGAVSLAEAMVRRRGRPIGPERFRADLGRWKVVALSAVEAVDHPAALRGKSVLIGFAGPGGEDVKTLPVVGRRPGVEVQARLASTLLAGTAIRPLPNVAALLAGAVAIVLGLLARRPLAILAFLPLWLAIASLAMLHAVEVPWVGPALVVVLASLLAVGGQSLDERSLRDEIQSAFAYQVDEETFACLLASPALRQPGHAVATTATILFLDVRNSTALGASVPDADFFERLNALFARLLPVVGEHGGTVLSFAGDGFMAVFGALRPLGNDAQAAVDAALAMARARSSDDPAIGIGLHRGPFLLGSLGGAARSQFSAIGNAVNLASRVESQTKAFGAVVLASAAVMERLPAEERNDPLSFVPKNHPDPLTVYRLA